jgi:hypothetical protein
MRAAGVIYISSAIAVLGVGLYLLITVGVGIESVVLALVAAALCVLARGLYRGTSRASHSAFVASSFVAVGFVLIPMYCYVQGGWSAVSELWLVLSLFAVVAVAHSLAVVFLVRAKPSAP